jgi:hypothetical protein
MAASANPRKNHRGALCSTPAEILGFAIPDPAAWPSEVREWFREVTCTWVEGPSDIFIFQCGAACHILLQDAISAVGLVGALRIDEWEWQTNNDYPAFVFSVSRLAEVVRVLNRAGYNVKILLPEEAPRRPVAARERIVDISQVRREHLR